MTFLPRQNVICSQKQTDLLQVNVLVEGWHSHDDVEMIYIVVDFGTLISIDNVFCGQVMNTELAGNRIDNVLVAQPTDVDPSHDVI